DDVMNKQRELIYKQRREVLDGVNLKETIWKMVSDYINSVVFAYTEGDVPDEWNFGSIRNELNGIVCSKEDFHYTQEELGSLNREDIIDELIERAEKKYAAQEELFTPEIFREVERAVLLRTVDRKWVDHIDAMEDLQGSVGLNAYAQRNPFVEYKILGGSMFDDMIASIREDTVRMLLTVIPRKKIQREQVLTGNASLKSEGGKSVKPTPQRKTVKTGPNEPCPCGSGRKYKKCCGSVGTADNKN
ncbi:MAG TPA: preprotein translocase subunit SecA, partial [Clostridiales bacterium]|nr:preprotein translocase subunit SecA [Clostridiales bacterium]